MMRKRQNNKTRYKGESLAFIEGILIHLKGIVRLKCSKANVFIWIFVIFTCTNIFVYWKVQYWMCCMSVGDCFS